MNASNICWINQWSEQYKVCHTLIARINRLLLFIIVTVVTISNERYLTPLPALDMSRHPKVKDCVVSSPPKYVYPSTQTCPLNFNNFLGASPNLLKGLSQVKFIGVMSGASCKSYEQRSGLGKQRCLPRNCTVVTNHR